MKEGTDTVLKSRWCLQEACNLNTYVYTAVLASDTVSERTVIERNEQARASE